MNAAALATLAQNYSNTAVDTVLGGDGVIGLGLAVLCFALSMLVTWAFLHAYMVFAGGAPRSRGTKTQAAGDESSDPDAPVTAKTIMSPMKALLGEGFLLIRLEQILAALWDTLLLYLRGIVSSALDTLNSLLREWLLYLGLLIVIAACFIFLEFHDIILDVSFELVQCVFRPILDQFIFPLLNIARALFGLAWPFFNASADVLSAATTGNVHIFFTCSSVAVLETLARDLALGLQSLGTSFITFVTTLLSNGRWDMLPGLVEFGEAINATRVVFDCYCPDAGPLVDFIYAIPTQTSLYMAIDCGVNTNIRFWQIFLNVIFTGQSLNTTLWAEEATCATFAVGSYFEDVFYAFCEFLSGLYELIEELISSMSVDARAVMFTRVAALHALADGKLNLPYAVRAMRESPGAVPMRALAMASMSAVDASITSAHGLRASLFAEVDPLILQKANWDTLPNISLIVQLGISALLRLAATPWSGIATGPVAVVIGTVNLTLNAAFHPFLAFGSVEGISFFQYGVLGDYTRLVVIAAVDLLAFIDDALPCTFSKPLQALVSTLEALAELVTGIGFAAQFPPWQVGVPPPVNCSLVENYCSRPPPANWSWFDTLPAYYAWNTSRLHRNLELLVEGGECTAYLLGCNTTADNNNSTNTTSNCTDAPLACTARSLNSVAVSLINLTFAFLLQSPDLLQFNSNLTTFADLPVAATQVAIEDFLICLGLLIDEFDPDDNMCLTATPPGPQPPGGGLDLPPDDPIGVFGAPPRTEWECRIDGGAYYWDGRQVIVLNISDIYDLNQTQFTCNITDSRECVIANSSSVEVIGSAPEDNVTLVVAPAWVDDASAEALVLVYNATTGTLLNTLPNASVLADLYNVSSVTEEDCTRPTPPPPMLGPQYACHMSSSATYLISPFQRDAASYLASFVYTDVAPGDLFPCVSTVPSTYTCASDGFMYISTLLGVRPIYYQNLTQTPLVDAPVECYADSSPPITPEAIICQANTLAYLSETPPLTYTAAQPLYWPVFYYPEAPPSTVRMPLACENTPPAGYACEYYTGAGIGSGSGRMTVDPSASVLQSALVFGGHVFLECANNTLLVSPTCTRITIEYTTGAETVVIELEGGEVRVYANDTKEAVPCLYQGITNVSALGVASALKAEDEHVAASDEGLNVHTLVRGAQATLAAQYAARASHSNEPIATVASLTQTRLLARIDPARFSGTQLLAQTLMLRQALVFGANVSIYRAKNLVCCFSEVVTLGGTFLVETVYAVVYLLQGILTLPADSSYEVELPTFAAARDALRDALCALSCEIMAFMPFTLSCPNSAGGTCNDLTVCGRNFLCDAADVFIVAVDLFVNLLTMVRALLLNEPPPPGSSILGTTCTSSNPSACLTSFIVFLIVAPIQALTQAARTLAGVGDCLLCSLARLVNPDAHCIGPFFAIVNTLANVIDSVATTLITVFVNLGLGFLQFFIYFFSGQFGQAWNAFSTYVLGFIFTLFKNFAVLIIESLKKMPYIGPIISKILSFFDTSCTVINDILTTFGARPLDCLSVGISSKRGLLSETHWLTLNHNVTAVWAPGGAAAGACAAAMLALNATNLYEVAENALVARELAFCTAAHLWVGPAATVAADPNGMPFPHPCDTLMPSVYARGHPLGTLDAATQARVLECVDARMRAEYVRADQNHTGTWIPHDLYYPGSISATVQLASDAMVAHDVWTQYSEDRLAVASQLVSPGYADAWTASDFSTAHLATLEPTASAASIYDKVLSDAGDFSLEAYARRALDTETKKREVRVLVGAQPSEERVVGIVRALWEPVFSPTSAKSVFRDDATGEPISLIGDVMQSLFKAIEARNEQTSISIPLTANTFTRMFQANDTRLLHQTAHGFVAAFGDIGAAMVRGLRALTPTSPINSTMRVVSSTLAVPAEFYYAFRGALALTHDFLKGKAGTAAAWIQNNATMAWLSEEAHQHRLREPYTAGAWEPRKSLVSTATARIFSALTSALLPLSRHGRTWLSLVSRAFTDSPISSSSMGGHYSSVAMRRTRMSRLAARVSLIASDGARDGAFIQQQRLMKGSSSTFGAAQVSNVSGLTCLFSVSNTTDNITTITYPLCDTCPGLDNFLGRVQRAAYAILFDFGVAVPTCVGCTLNEYPSLHYTLSQFEDFNAYIMDPAAKARVGDSPALPVRAPWKNINNWRWFEDPTPNKTGFSNLVALWSATLDYIRGTVGTLPSIVTISTVNGVQTAAAVHASGVMERVRARWQQNYTYASSPVHGPIRTFLVGAGHDALAWLGPPAKTAAAANTLSAASTTVDQGPFTSFGQVALAWFNYFLSFILCPYPALFLNTKRFSTFEALLIGVAVFLVLFSIAQALFQGQVIVTFIGSATLTTAIMMCSWLILTYEYGFLCYVNLPPALPVGVADDVMYMLGYTVAPKCAYAYGVVNEDYYDNTTCYACANWRAGLFTVPNFYLSFEEGGRFGFQDIRYNLAFILRAGFPNAYAALRPGGAAYDLPVIGALLSAGFFQTPLAAYAGFDPETVPDTPFAQFWQGATWVTGIANLLLITSILYLVYKLFGTIILQTLAFIFAVLLILMPLILFIFTGFYVISSFGLVDSLDPASSDNAYDPLAIFQRDYASQRRRKDEEEQEEGADDPNAFSMIDMLRPRTFLGSVDIL